MFAVGGFAVFAPSVVWFEVKVYYEAFGLWRFLSRMRTSSSVRGVKVKEQKADVWFGKKDLAGKRFTDKTPPCIEALYLNGRTSISNAIS